MKYYFNHYSFQIDSYWHINWYKLITHCLLDALLFAFYYDSASSLSTTKQARRLIDLNKLEYGTNLFVSVINN